MCDVVTELINQHLQNKRIFIQNPSWKINQSKLGGRGIFATKDIKPGEIIFIDTAIILGLRYASEAMCANCFQNYKIYKCPNQCGLYICSKQCQQSNQHIMECQRIKSWITKETNTDNIYKFQTLIRSLFLNQRDTNLIQNLASHQHPQHGIEIDLLIRYKYNLNPEEEYFMRSVCAVLDANAFKIGNTLRGLYPLSSLLNHSCQPNTTHVFDEKHNMIFKSSKLIHKGDEIFNSYCRLIWGTLTRQLHLNKTKHFYCCCKRCSDPSEFSTYMNAMLCNCGSLLLPQNPTQKNSNWQCKSCFKSFDESDIIFMSSVVSSRATNLDGIDELLNFHQGKVAATLPESNQIVVELKYRAIWILGYKKGFLFKDLTDELLDTKQKYCIDILEILKKLDLGACKMRGLVLFELYKCQKERSRRQLEETLNSIKENDIYDIEQEMERVLKEAANIFLFDSSAPTEIKLYWERNNIKSNWMDYFNVG